jgi:hypothetical protein
MKRLILALFLGLLTLPSLAAGRLATVDVIDAQPACLAANTRSVSAIGAILICWPWFRSTGLTW